MAQPLVGRDQPFARPVNQLIQSNNTVQDKDITVLPQSPDSADHSWYPDIVIPPSERREIIFVLPMETLTDSFIDRIDSIPPNVETIIVAPRNRERAVVDVVQQIANPDDQTAIIYRTIGDEARWLLSVEGMVTPVWLTQGITRSDTAPYSPSLVNTARLGLGRSNAVLQHALQSGQSAAVLSVTDDAQTVTILASLADALTTLPSPPGRPVEQNYLIVPFPFLGQSNPVIAEGVLVWSLITVTSLLILFAVARPRRVRRYAMAIAHNFLLFPGFFLLLVAILISANLGIRVLDERLSIEHVALPLAVAKFSLGLVILTLMHPFLHGRFRRSSTVYSGAALFLLMIGGIIASVFSLILGAFFVLAFIFGFLFSLSHKGYLKAIFLLLAVIPGVYLFINVAAVADILAVRSLLTPPLWREIVTAVLILPLVLMFFRLDVLIRKFSLLPVVGMVAGVAVAISIATVISETNDQSVVEVAVTERYAPGTDDSGLNEAATGVVAIEGSIPAGEVVLTDQRGAYARCSDPPCTFAAELPSLPLEFRIEPGRSLDRHTVTYSINLAEPAIFVKMELTTASPVQLYASDLPADVQPGERSETFTFRPGPFPPARWSGTITLRDVPADTAITAVLSAEFAGDPSSVAYTGPAKTFILDDYTREWTVRSRRVLP